MADTEVVALVARAKDEASAALAKVDASMRQMGVTADATGRKFSGLGQSFLGVNAGALLAGVAIGGTIAVLSDATRAAIEDEKSVASLGASLKANVGAWDGETAAIEKTIASRMRLGFTDEQQRAGLQLLVAATHDVTRALDLERTAMDLAAFKSISLEEASTALIRTEGGQFRMLKTLIGSTKDITTAEQALAAVHNATAGSAESLANTTGGKLNAANIKMSEAMEKLGYTLLPAVASATQVVADLVGTLGDVFGVFSSIIGGFGDVVNGAVTAINQANDAQNTAATAARAHEAAIVALQAQVANGIITEDEYIAKSAELDAAYQRLIIQTEGFTTGTMSAGDAAAATAEQMDRMDVAAGKASGSMETLSGWVYKGAEYYRQYTTDAGETGAALDNVAGRAIAAANGLDTTTDALGNTKDAAIEAWTEADYLGRVLAALPTTTTVGVDLIVRTLVDAAKGAGAETTVGGGGVAGYKETPSPEASLPQRYSYKAPSRGGGGGAGGAKAAANDAKKAAEDAAKAIDDAYEKAGKAGDDYFDAVHKGRLKEIEDNHRVANDAISQARKASQEQLRLALAAIDKELAARKRLNAEPITAMEQQQASIEAAQQMRDLQEALAQAQAGGDVAEIRRATEALQNFQAHQAIDAARAAQEAADAAAEAWAEQSRIAAQEAEAARQADIDKQQEDEDARYRAQQAAEDERWEKQRIKFDEQIRAQEDNTKATLANANALHLKYLQDAVTYAETHGTAQDLLDAINALEEFKQELRNQKVKGKASGGTVFGGEAYIVGERGPELFVPGTIGTIVPHSRAAVVNLSTTMHISGADDPERWASRYVQDVARRLRREGIIA